MVEINTGQKMVYMYWILKSIDRNMMEMDIGSVFNDLFLPIVDKDDPQGGMRYLAVVVTQNSQASNT